MVIRDSSAPMSWRRSLSVAGLPTRSLPAALAMLLLIAAVLLASRVRADVPTGAVPSTSRQVIRVLGRGWDDVHATAQRFERTGDGWRPVGSAVPAVLGSRGLAWGRGAGVTHGQGGPRKREGDMRSPAGVFHLTGAFGFAPSGALPLRIPYLQITEPCECVDDAASTHYNTVVDRTRVRRDWQSAEVMRRVGLYRWGAFVGHNIDPVQPGAGSCIFMHIWSGPDAGTAGCTALEEAHLVEMLKWLREEDQPMLVQMPAAVHARMRGAWRLP